MICQKCKKATATVCVSKVVDSRKTDIYLCQECANEGTVSELKSAFGLFDMLPSHFIFGGDYGARVKKAGAGRCGGCGKGFDEIQSDGKLGCAMCYEAFRDKLRPIVLRIHRSAQHRGRGPRSYAADAGTAGAGATGTATAERPLPESETGSDTARSDGARPGDNSGVAALRAELAAAIRAEEYEKAAELRDKIRESEYPEEKP